ncbi:extensin [Altericroceibacterium spongiae]|uniref:Extensin n=1 Tax=Altericroceibacterium spongiae TaxID=2320269 RepID=A0A420ECL8_9SPHN|nr:extensin family protein [Altericroceibacterium spongiae]RKF18403.1 extensin [Altericroceibacterium spongiae]
MSLAAFLKDSKLDSVIAGLLVVVGLVLAGWLWLKDHPEHNPWASLDLGDAPGWATRRKLADLHSDAQRCRKTLQQSDVAFVSYAPAGEGACRREDRISLTNTSLSPASPQSSCSVAAGIIMWLRQSVNPAARRTFGSEIAKIEHLGTYNCRRINGRDDGAWSQHSTGNAIDIAAFLLKDGRRISLLKDWGGGGEEASFLRHIRNDACGIFSTVLSPDYNAAHTDHFHFDQQSRIWTVCR